MMQYFLEKDLKMIVGSIENFRDYVNVSETLE